MHFRTPLSLLSELLQLWHAYRNEILITAVVLVAVLGCLTRYRSKKARSVRLASLHDPSIPVKGAQQLPGLHDVPASEKAVARIPVSKQSAPPRRVTGTKRSRTKDTTALHDAPASQYVQPYVFYFTLGGSTKAYAEKVASGFLLGTKASTVLDPLVYDLTEIELDEFFLNLPQAVRHHDRPVTPFYCLLLPSYNIDTELLNFLEHLRETHHDFRIDTAPLRSLAGYSVFGLGDKEGWPSEDEGYCSQAVEADKWLSRLTAGKRAFPLGTANTKGASIDAEIEEWQHGLLEVMVGISEGRGLGEGAPGSGEAVESADEDSAAETDDGDEIPAEARRPKQRSRPVLTQDLEDLGGSKSGLEIDFTTTKTSVQSSGPKEMVPKSSPTYQALTKQGYQIVGSHSGVKICRWTKSALRGRGSCYKYSFYGISSHLCMEATPSLSCSNKCVFCWRHGTNPVGTTWRWTVDPPQMVFDGIKEGHYKKIKMMRGVPGVRAERFQEAMRIRHCALSLVGEPIFYPHINELLAMLHKEHISSFLVCNAQHPDQLAALGPVTQLYVSIDASNAASLKKIDRPLHRDYWQRFLRCMDILQAKRYTHRTVFRLTLVKGFNIEEEAEGYADLVLRALPAFVEVKGVTYCGTSTSKGAGLSMQNVPFYEEVTAFVLALEGALNRRGLSYGIAAEHSHSCCILLADKSRFYRPRKSDGQMAWHTLIEYSAFFACLDSGKPFGPEDYIGDPTPEWALWGKGGFDPRDVRVDRKGRVKDVEAQTIKCES